MQVEIEKKNYLQEMVQMKKQCTKISQIESGGDVEMAFAAINTENLIQKKEESLKNKIKIKLNILMVISSVSIVSTLILCYFLSESEATYIHNFPRDYVTNTGREYPEVIIFRYGMISTSFILVTLFYLVFSWMKKKAEEIGYEGGTFYPLRFVAIFGILCQTVTTSSMDVNFRFDYHAQSAFSFFFIVFPTLGLITLKISRMRKINEKFTDKFFYWAKVVICWFLVYENIVTILAGIFHLPIKKTVLISMDEWFCLYTLIVWFWCFYEDWKTLSLQFDLEKMEWSVKELRTQKKQKQQQKPKPQEVIIEDSNIELQQQMRKDQEQVTQN